MLRAYYTSGYTLIFPYSVVYTNSSSRPNQQSHVKSVDKVWILFDTHLVSFSSQMFIMFVQLN